MTGGAGPRRDHADAATPRFDLDACSAAQLRTYLAAGAEVKECLRVLAKGGDNIVGELLRGEGSFFEWDHYPRGDVYDPVTHAQYYYHAHPESEERGEHGHFHTFLRSRGMPARVRPVVSKHLRAPTGPDATLSHLVAISMDHYGVPVSLFTTNRWVTGEVWYAAEDVIAMLDRFAIDMARPSWVVNRWITAMLILFRPQIEALIRARDKRVAAWARQFPERNPYDDHGLEITSSQPISIDAQIDAIDDALSRPRR